MREARRQILGIHAVNAEDLDGDRHRRPLEGRDAARTKHGVFVFGLGLARESHELVDLSAGRLSHLIGLSSMVSRRRRLPGGVHVRVLPLKT